MIHINLTFDSINVSAQVGDTVYYTYGGQMLGGFDAQTDLSNTKRLGEIIAINGNTITVEVDDSILNIQDIIIMINIVLGTVEFNQAADLSGDGIVNVLDVIQLMNLILDA